MLEFSQEFCQESLTELFEGGDVHGIFDLRFDADGSVNFWRLD